MTRSSVRLQQLKLTNQSDFCAITSTFIYDLIDQESLRQILITILFTIYPQQKINITISLADFVSLYFDYLYYNNKIMQKSQGQKFVPQSLLPKEKGPQHVEPSPITANQIYTNISQTDRDNNGQTLTLKTDQTFHLESKNYAFDSKFQGQWNWSSYFTIDGIWSYDKEKKSITLTATGFGASLQRPLKNQQEEIAKGFPNRVVTTQNFNFQESKEIKAFVIWWDYDAFGKVIEGKLKRK